MSAGPVIAFGQQPCGIFPRRYLVAKVRTARRLQAELGGEIVFFYHDSDHDPRETQTTLRHLQTGKPRKLNFTFINKLQRKYTPLYLKQIAPGCREKLTRQLPAYVPPEALAAFRLATADTVAEFCLQVYAALGLLDGLRVVRSSDPAVRRSACAVPDFFVDVPYAGEVVRARVAAGALRLHEGGDSFIDLPAADFGPEQVSPTRDTRLRWMQSVLRCTHYVAGAGERAYLRQEDAPEITFINREAIDRADEAWTEPLCP